MFQYKDASMCSYFPHLSLKDKSLFDLLQFTGNPKDAVYVLECAAGIETNVVENNDWTTHHISDWTGMFPYRVKGSDSGVLVSNPCPGDKTVGYAEEVWAPGQICQILSCNILIAKEASNYKIRTFYSGSEKKKITIIT